MFITQVQTNKPLPGSVVAPGPPRTQVSKPCFIPKETEGGLAALLLARRMKIENNSRTAVPKPLSNTRTPRTVEPGLKSS